MHLNNNINCYHGDGYLLLWLLRTHIGELKHPETQQQLGGTRSKLLPSMLA